MVLNKEAAFQNAMKIGVAAFLREILASESYINAS